MKKSWLVLAVLLGGNVGFCRAGDAKDEPLPAAIKADSQDAKKSVKTSAGKDFVEAIDAKDAAACGPVCTKKSGIVWPASQGCRSGRGPDCCHRLWAWLTYCPVKKPCLADCCHHCNDCHVPPLYLYFLDPYHACAAGDGRAMYDAYGCAPGCAACAHR
jgi:hypothetical protein